MSEAIHDFLAGKKVSVPFDIETDQGTFHCQKVLRILAGRRLVVEAELNGQPILLKLFTPNSKGKRELTREIAGYQACKQAGVPVPEQLLVSHGLAGCLAVGYEFLSDATTFTLSETEGSAVDTLLELMLLCHQRGIYQQDIHPDNLLVTSEGLFLIDLASIRGKAGKPLSRDKSLTNLALLIAQFLPEQQDILLQKLEGYFGRRDWLYDTKAKNDFRTRLNKNWQKRKKNYLSKCFRSCTMTAHKRTKKFEYAFKRPFFEKIDGELITELDAIVEQGRVLKAGNSATVVVTKLAGRDVVIKRYNIKSFWHFLKRCWRPSRAANAWRYGNLLTLIGVPTPTVLGFIEKRHGPLRATAYLISDFKADGRELNKVFSEDMPTEPVLEQVRLIFKLMKKYRVTHGDLKASNLLVTLDNKIELIDLDAMREHNSQTAFDGAYQRDRERFLRNWTLSKNSIEAFRNV